MIMRLLIKWIPSLLATSFSPLLILKEAFFSWKVDSWISSYVLVQIGLCSFDGSRDFSMRIASKNI